MRTTSILATLVFLSSRSTSSLIFASAYGGSSSDGEQSSIDLDSIRNFQLGNYSYQISRVGKYDSYDNCNGHQARHAMLVMSNIQNHCTNVSELSYPAQNAATQLLREGNYFDCGREQLWVDVVDGEDEAQNCVLGYINANNRVWVNSGELVKPGIGFAALGGLVGVVLVML